MKEIMPTERIENKIYLIRGKKVMMDRDLAILYGVQTKVLLQAVKRNIKRFPIDFMFQLTKKEILRCQIGTSSDIRSWNLRSQTGFGLINSVDYVFHCMSAYAAIELTQ